MGKKRGFDDMEKRLYRRRRRIRNQVIAYIVVVIFFAAIVVGAVSGIRVLTKMMAEKKQADELAEQLEQMEDEEGTIIEPPVSVEMPQEDVDWLEEMVASSIENMPLEDKVAGLFIIAPEAITGVSQAIQAGDGTKEALDRYPVGGFVYFEQNIIDKDQFTQMLSNTMGMRPEYPMFLAVDEEGGAVRRIGNSNIEVNEIGDMADIGASGDTMAAYNAGKEIGFYLCDLGLNVDFAPVADVVGDSGNSAIGKRSFGSDPALVGGMAAAAVNGIQEMGVSACLKHFPGIGSVGEDTHEGMAVLEKNLEELRASEFPAFQAGIEAGADFIMISHVSAPNVVGDNTPCSLSEEVVTSLLRGELGYNGIVITDAMNMGAITEYYAAGDAAVQALKAGADMVLMPEDFEQAYQGVLQAVQEGVIAEERINESLKRIYRVKLRDRIDTEGNVVDVMDAGQEAGGAEEQGAAETDVTGGESGDGTDMAGADGADGTDVAGGEGADGTDVTGAEGGE